MTPRNGWRLVTHGGSVAGAQLRQGANERKRLMAHITELEAEVALYHELEAAVRTSRVYPGLGVDVILARIAELEAEVLTPSQRRQVLGAALSYDERLQGGIVPYDFPNVWQEAPDD